MALRNYSVTDNAVVAPAAGSITLGYAVCGSSPFVGYLTATTANRAAIGSGATLSGIAISTGVANATVAIVGSGHVDASIIGTLSGSGSYVDVTSTGALVRSSSVSVDTIGVYEPGDGGVFVDIELHVGAATSAQDDGYVHLSAYGSTNAALALADAAAVAAGKDILWTNDVTLTANITVASRVVVRGGSVAGAYTLTFAHSVECGREQFYDAATTTIAFSDGHKQDAIFPEWGGADPGGYVCTGAAVSGGLAAAIGDATVGGSGFDSTKHTGKVICVFEQVGTDAFRSTVLSVTSSSRLEMAANSTVDVTASGSQVWIGTDSLTALRAAIVASRGEIWVSLAPGGEYGISDRLDPRPSQGGLKLDGNFSWVRFMGTGTTVKMFSPDDGTASTAARSGAIIRNVTFSGCRLAQDGVYMANSTNAEYALAMMGDWTNVDVYHVKRYGHYHHACQVSKFTRCQVIYCTDRPWTMIACNGTVMNSCRGSNTSSDALYIDSWANGGGNSYGGGDVMCTGFVAETVSGRGAVILDTGGGGPGSGSTVVFRDFHLEGVLLDGIHVAREATVVEGGSLSGPGGTTYYPFRITSAGHGSTVIGVQAQSYGSSQLGGIVETGATNLVLSPVYNMTLNAFVDPVVTDGWAGKVQIRRAAGDVQLQGKLFVGTSSPTASATTPSHSIEVESGSARLGKGHVMSDIGEVSLAHGGIGLGVNGLLRSEEISNASWTKTNATATADQAAAPFGAGTTADRLTQTSSGGYARQNVLATAMGGLTVNGSAFLFSVWLRTVSGTLSARLTLENTVAGVGSSGSISSDWALSTAWRRCYVAFTSANAGADGIRASINDLSATLDVYVWGAQLEFWSAGYGLGQRHPGPYAKTLGTARQVKTDGPVFNSPPVVPGDNFTAIAGGKVAVAGAVVTVTDARCTATCMVDVEPTNAAAVALGIPYRTPAAGSFALTFGGAPAGTETYNYRLTEVWKL